MINLKALSMLRKLQKKTVVNNLYHYKKIIIKCPQMDYIVCRKMNVLESRAILNGVKNVKCATTILHWVHTYLRLTTDTQIFISKYMCKSCIQQPLRKTKTKKPFFSNRDLTRRDNFNWEDTSWRKRGMKREKRSWPAISFVTSYSISLNTLGRPYL